MISLDMSFGKITLALDKGWIDGGGWKKVEVERLHT